MSENSPLVIEPGEYGDYILREGHTSFWVTIGNISVYVRRTKGGVAVSLYPQGREMDDEIAGTWAHFSEAIYEDELGNTNDGQGEGEDSQESESPTQAGDTQRHKGSS